MSLKKEIYKILTIALVVAYCLHTSSCASTKAAPSGGPKDTIPPVVLAMNPADNSTNFPLEDGVITITFDEYVQVKDPAKNIIVSPPLKKQVKTRIKGKSVVFSFPEPLQPDQTYSLYCGEAIVDNNEGNPYYGLGYSFSTGTAIDSMMLSGTVVDAVTLLPVANATVALYENAKDSTVITDIPSAIARSDKWGYFTVRNLKPVPYYVFAYTDGNTNNRYDQGSESIAFLDYPVVPNKIMSQDTVCLKYYDPKDTLACLARPSEITLNMFAETSMMQFIKDYKRFSRRGSYITFNASDVQIDSFALQGVSDERIIRQFNANRDSMTFWIKGEGRIDDTLRLAIKYHKTDSTGTLVPQVENLKFVAPYENKRAKKSNDKEDDKRKDLLEMTVSADKTMIEQNGIELFFPAPLTEMDTASISFIMKNPKMIESAVKYTIEEDSLESNKYIIRPDVQFAKGNEYILKFPMATFKDVNGFTNDSSITSVSLPVDEKLSSLTLELKNVNARYIIELTNPQRTTVYRKYIVDKDCELLFPYLKANEYSIRITEDLNSNGKLDTGDLLTRKQPEKVMMYTLSDGTTKMKINERTDIVQDIDIAEMFSKEGK